MSDRTEGAPPGEPASSEGAPGKPTLGEHLLKARYLATVVVFLALLHSVTFLLMGARSAVVTYWHVVTGKTSEGTARPGLELLHSLDLFLISLVLMILALGVAKLFLLRSRPGARRIVDLPSWLQIESFSDLKFLLWETILTTLLVAALPILATGLFEKLDWTALVVPATVLLLALSLYFMRKA
jgi:uncharacterized membrane protein YqhA